MPELQLSFVRASVKSLDGGNGARCHPYSGTSIATEMTPRFFYALFSLLAARLSFASALGDIAVDRRATSALSFTASKWIWTTTTSAPNVFVALRKDFTPPAGKSLIAAEILITADNSMNLFVNGDYIGSGTPLSRLRFAQRFCVDLLPSYNVFAVNASTTAASGGAMLATILLTYSDGTTDTLRSDSSWRVHAGLPVGFEQLSFDDTAWPVATVVGAYGAEPWETVNIPSDPPVITLSRAEWVWTDVVPASGKVPASSRAFRRTFPLAPGQVPMSASILIAADNEYTLYVNGVAIGSGANSRVAQHYTVNFQPDTSEIVLAVAASNTDTVASTAGVILAMEVNMRPSGRAECTAGAFSLTDPGWVSTKGAIPVGWEQPGFDDSAWPVVVAEELYGGPTWGTIIIAAPSPVVTV
ncbi:hypothetical protein DFH09DRAFT_1439549 [Mycena vulgaris]|nr:hypothetical protein DFH09DRAFT_1439549 [Mycena vulgaris]